MAKMTFTCELDERLIRELEATATAAGRSVAEIVVRWGGRSRRSRRHAERRRRGCRQRNGISTTLLPVAFDGLLEKVLALGRTPLLPCNNWLDRSAESCGDRLRQAA